MEILEYGDKANQKIILIHGFESPYQIWEPYVEHYKNDFHVIVPILPGHNPRMKEEFESFEACAKELEDFYIENYGEDVYVVYGMSMGGVLASHIWRNQRLRIKKLIMESSPLLGFGKLMTVMQTNLYLQITGKARRRDPKTVRQAVGSMVREKQLEVFLELLDHISDTTITNYLAAVGKFKLPANIDTPNSQLTYFYGGNINEVLFRKVAKYIKKHYPNANTICLKGKGHCEEALLVPDRWMVELDKILEGEFYSEAFGGSTQRYVIRR